MAPMLLNTIEDIEKVLPPHKAGTYPPTIEPIVIKVNMRVFVLIQFYLEDIYFCSNFARTT